MKKILMIAAALTMTTAANAAEIATTSWDALDHTVTTVNADGSTTTTAYVRTYTATQTQTENGATTTVTPSKTADEK